MSCADANSYHRFAALVRIATALFVTALVSWATLPPLDAAATDMPITATLRDGAPPALTVAPLPYSGVTQTSSIVISGSIHNITQIMVYIDGVLYSTIPAAANQGTYSITLMLDPGKRTIKLVGVDAYSAAQVEQLVNVNYVPPVSDGGTQPSTPGQQANEAIHQAGQAANQLGKQAGEQIDQASAYGPMKVVVDGAYGALTALGFITVRDGFSSTSFMFWRFIVMSTGVAFSVFTWAVYSIGTRLKLLPVKKQSPKLTMPIRLLGIGLFLLPLFFFL